MVAEVFEDRDHVAWHQGIKTYGFWCFKINNPSWLEKIKALQHALAPQLMDDYMRFPHITVATVGLMHRENGKLAKQQVSRLLEDTPKVVSLSWQEASSYKHVPIIRLKTNSLTLEEIRKRLHGITRGDDTSLYDPHITLGYYAFPVELSSVYKNLERELLENSSEHFFNELHFCTYETSSIKGSLKIRNTIKLVNIV
ncbi:MAG TPA: hypothetical protein ENK82_02345 [Campylobacterales bacterium]|nr:hypothetical protein [Campylobacterales bacterium]